MRQFFCLFCNVFFWKKNTILCSFCKGSFFKRHVSLKRRFEGEVPHYYLFRWSDETDFFCKLLAYYFKNKPQIFFKEWAVFFSDLSELEGITCVVPESHNLVNHARELARSIMKQIPISGVYEMRVKESGAHEQKRLNRDERFKGVKTERASLDFKKWVFVDDILVSGATYMYTKNRVRSSPQIILTLFYKEVGD